MCLQVSSTSQWRIQRDHFQNQKAHKCTDGRLASWRLNNKSALEFDRIYYLIIHDESLIRFPDGVHCWLIGNGSYKNYSYDEKL